MFSVEMMEGGHGDALLVEYGTSTRKHRVLIDAGTRFSFDAIRSRLQALPLGGFELFVVITYPVGYDLVLYLNSSGWDLTKVLSSGVPVLSTAGYHAIQMGIGR